MTEELEQEERQTEQTREAEAQRERENLVSERLTGDEADLIEKG
jgi:hypothetical protein